MVWCLLILGFWLLLLLVAQRQFFHIALLGFPGVVMHELMHLLVGVVLLARPVSFNLIPRRVGNQWQFGSVSFTGLTIFNSAPVALAPLLLLGVAWLAFYRWMLPSVLGHQYLEAALGGYLIACALFYSVPSVTDLKVGGISTLFWLLIAGVGWWFWMGPHRVMGF